MSTLAGMSAEENAAFTRMQNDEPPEEIEVVADDGGEEEETPVSDAQDDAPDAVDEAPADETPKEKYVRHEALRQEREKRKAVERELQQAREERARFDERLKIIQESVKPQQEAPAEIEFPDPEADPIAAIKFATDFIRQQEARQREAQQRSTAEQQQNEQLRQWTAGYAARSQEYEKTDPASAEAYSHFVNSVYQDALAQGYPPEAALHQARQIEINVAHKAMQEGVNPRARIVELAKGRGWAPKAKAATADEQIERTAAAVTRNKSLSSAGGSVATTEMTVQRLLEMPAAEFEAWTTKNPAKTKRLMGA